MTQEPDIIKAGDLLVYADSHRGKPIYALILSDDSDHYLEYALFKYESSPWTSSRPRVTFEREIRGKFSKVISRIE